MKLNKLTENSAFEVYYSSFSPNECFIYITKIIVVEIDFLSIGLFTRVDSWHYSCFQGIIYSDKFDHHSETKNFDAYSCSLKFRRNHSNSLWTMRFLMWKHSNVILPCCTMFLLQHFGGAVLSFMWKENKNH